MHCVTFAHEAPRDVVFRSHVKTPSPGSNPTAPSHVSAIKFFEAVNSPKFPTNASFLIKVSRTLMRNSTTSVNSASANWIFNT